MSSTAAASDEPLVKRLRTTTSPVSSSPISPTISHTTSPTTYHTTYPTTSPTPTFHPCHALMLRSLYTPNPLSSLTTTPSDPTPPFPHAWSIIQTYLTTRSTLIQGMLEKRNDLAKLNEGRQTLRNAARKLPDHTLHASKLALTTLTTLHQTIATTSPTPTYLPELLASITYHLLVLRTSSNVHSLALPRSDATTTQCKIELWEKLQDDVATVAAL